MKKQEPTLRLLVDEAVIPQAKSAFPLPDMGSVSQKVIELSQVAIQDNLNRTLKAVLSVLEGAELSNNSLGVTEIKFTLAFDSTGEVSLASVIKGSLAGKTGLEFTIKKT